MNNIILAIDLGKYKSVDCALDQNTGEFRLATFDTSRAELQRRITKERPGVVVIEACSLAGWVHQLCGELGVRCLDRQHRIGGLEVQASQTQDRQG